MLACYGHTGWLTVITVCNRREHTQSRHESLQSVREFMCVVVCCVCVRSSTETRVDNVCFFTNYILKYVDCVYSVNKSTVVWETAEGYREGYEEGEVQDSWLCLWLLISLDKQIHPDNKNRWPVGKANFTLWKIRDVLNQQIEPQCAQQRHTHTHTWVQSIHTI